MHFAFFLLKRGYISVSIHLCDKVRHCLLMPLKRAPSAGEGRRPPIIKLKRRPPIIKQINQKRADCRPPSKLYVHRQHVLQHSV